MKKYLKYMISCSIAGVLVCFILFTKGMNPINTKEGLKNLTDAFFAVGILYVCIGLLILVSNAGTFAMLGYGLIQFVNFFRRDISKEKYKTFYEYRLAKEQNKKCFCYLLIIGLILIVISMLFLWQWFRYQ